MFGRSCLVISLVLAPRILLGWGQPAHCAVTANTLAKYGNSMPEHCRSPETRDAYLYASYLPDQYILHGPEYVHLDRQFSLLLLSHARTKRQLALAYGFASHQEQDIVGHGRYITESGGPHVFKELVIDTRFFRQGSRLERQTVKNMQSVWDAGQISAASRDYVERYGDKYPVLTAANVKATGYVFAAYLTAIKGILHALWYGKVKWSDGLHPRSTWDLYQDESVEQTWRWVRSPSSFGTDPQDLERMQTFGFVFSEDGVEAPSLPDPDPLGEVSPAITLGRLQEAMAGYKKSALAGDGLMSNLLGRLEASHSHVMTRDTRLPLLGERLLQGEGVELVERAQDGFHSVGIRVKSKKKLLEDMRDFLGADGFDVFGLTGPTPSKDLFEQLKGLADRAADEAEDEPE